MKTSKPKVTVQANQSQQMQTIYLPYLPYPSFENTI